MKDIYELLNEINIDVTEIQEMEVSEIERKRGKKKLMNSIKNKRRASKKIAIAASLVVIMGISSIVITKPAWAMNIPIIGDLIQNNLINNNSNYKDYIQAVGTTKSEQGIDITFESAVADRNVLNLSFVVKNNNESIVNNYTDAMLIPTSLKVNGKSASTGAGASFEMIDENTIRVLKNISWDYGKLPNRLNIDIEISEMFGKKGNWDVSFALDSKEIDENTYVEKLDKVINANGFEYDMEEIIITPLTTSIEYSSEYKDDKNEVTYLDFIMFDDQGMEIKWTGGHGSGSRPKSFNFSSNFISNPNTKVVNIIPWYRDEVLRDKEEKLPPTKVNIEDFSPINLKINEDTSIDINNCIIDGEFLIIDCSYRYFDRIMNRVYFSDIYVNVDGKDSSEIESQLAKRDMWGSYTDEEKKKEMKKESDMYEKYSSTNGNRILVIEIGDAKDIEIGCYDGSSAIILKDEAFTVTKK